MNKSEFISKIKTKYPGYAEVDDNVLYDKIITKYPQYKNQVTETKTDRITELKGISAKAKQDYASAIKQKNEALPTFAKEAAGNIISGAEVAGGFTPASPAIMGIGEAARAGLQGKKIPEIFKQAIMAASLDVALGGTSKYKGLIPKGTPEIIKKGIGAYEGAGSLVANLGKSLMQTSVKVAKRVPHWAMNQALKNPDILITPQPIPNAVKNEIIDIAENLKSEAIDKYGKGLEQLNVPRKAAAEKAMQAINNYKIASQKEFLTVNEMKKLSKTSESMKNSFKEVNKYLIPSNGVKTAAKELGIGDLGLQQIAATVKNILNKQGAGIPEESLDLFFAGKKVDFDTARKINGALATIERNYAGDEKMTTFVFRVGKIKEKLMNAMERKIPGVGELNSGYKDSVETVNNAIKNLKSEGSAKLIGQQLAGKISNKTEQANTVIELQKRTQLPFLEKLKNSIAREEFEKKIDANIGYLTIQGLAGGTLGAAAGFSSGDPWNALKGAGLGVAGTIGAAGLSPQTIGKLLTMKVPQTLGALGRVGRIGLEQQGIGMLNNETQR